MVDAGGSPEETSVDSRGDRRDSNTQIEDPSSLALKNAEENKQIGLSEDNSEKIDEERQEEIASEEQEYGEEHPHAGSPVHKASQGAGFAHSQSVDGEELEAEKRDKFADSPGESREIPEGEEDDSEGDDNSSGDHRASILRRESAYKNGHVPQDCVRIQWIDQNGQSLDEVVYCDKVYYSSPQEPEEDEEVPVTHKSSCCTIS